MCDRASEEYGWLRDGADAGNVKRLVLLEEILDVERDTAGVEEFRMFSAPRLNEGAVGKWIASNHCES